jgi:hypothetical protein
MNGPKQVAIGTITALVVATSLWAVSLEGRVTAGEYQISLGERFTKKEGTKLHESLETTKIHQAEIMTKLDLLLDYTKELAQQKD